MPILGIKGTKKRGLSPISLWDKRDKKTWSVPYFPGRGGWGQGLPGWASPVLLFVFTGKEFSQMNHFEFSVLA